MAVATGTAILAGTLGSAALGAWGQSQARDAAQSATTGANQLLAQQNQQTRQDLAPYRQFGQTAMRNLTQGPQAYQHSPYYNYLRDQALTGVQNTAAGQGTLYSGNTLAALTQRAADVASMDYNNWANRQMNQAQLGANAAAQTGQLGQQSATQQGGNLMGYGSAAANTYGNTGAIMANAIGSGVNNYLYMQGLNNPQPNVPAQNTLPPGVTGTVPNTAQQTQFGYYDRDAQGGLIV